MSEDPRLAEVAALVGDPARANMLSALADGRALTAGELAYAAGVSPQTASGHLAKLADARLLAVAKQGRHRYYRLATPLVGRMLESIMAVAADAPPRYRPAGRFDAALRFARTCYDHLAGQVGVAITDALVARGHMVLSEEGGELTEAGVVFLTAFGIEQSAPRKRIFCRPCLDWSERRYHVAGVVGAAIWRRCLEREWFTRERDSRTLQLTATGAAGLAQTFGVDLSGKDQRGVAANAGSTSARVALRV